MNDYLQPDFYRFNEDSLILKNYLVSEISSARTITDLGAGCGIIGIELARIFRPDQLNLVEPQSDFMPSLEKNCEIFLEAEIKRTIYQQSFGNWQAHQKSDLIVCNPPYYLPGRGVKASDPRRAQARSFIHENWGTLLKCIDLNLKADGSAWVVIKNDPDIMKEIRHSLQGLNFSSHVKEMKGLNILRLIRLDKN